MTESILITQPNSWLDKAFFQKALESYCNDNAVEIIAVTSTTSSSDHFGSSLFKFKINFKSSKSTSEAELLNVVVKMEPMADEMEMDSVMNNPLFKNEIRMYTKTLPAIRKLFERNGVKIEFAPE